MNLVASYHELNDESEVTRCRFQIREIYGKATLPNQGGVALRGVRLVFLTAFACSFAASLKDLAKVFPDWIKLDRDDKLLRIVSNSSPDTSYQVKECVKEHRKAFTKEAFGDNDVCVILKAIAAVGTGRIADRRNAQLESETQESTDDSLSDDGELRRRKTAQSALYDGLINVEFKRLLLRCKIQASNAHSATDNHKLRYRNGCPRLTATREPGSQLERLVRRL